MCHFRYLRHTLISQLGWSLPFAWAGVWAIITIPWVQSDLRREKAAWQEGGMHGGIPYTDDINAPIPRTRFKSVQDHLPHFLPWNREKPTPPSTSSEGTVQHPGPSELEAGNADGPTPAPAP